MNGITKSRRDAILTLFCERFDGREEEIGCKPVVYGDLIMIASELNIPIEEVADILLSELNQIMPSIPEAGL